MHGLRRAVGVERIETRARGTASVSGEDELDLDRFERCARARPGCPRGARAGRRGRRPARGAGDLGGPALADMPSDRPGAPRRRSASRSCGSEALEFRYDAELGRRPTRRLVADSRGGRPRASLSRAVSPAADARAVPRRPPADAPQVYRDSREVLAEELGLEPGAETAGAGARSPAAGAGGRPRRRGARALDAAPGAAHSAGRAAGSRSQRSPVCSATRARGSSPSPARAERERPASRSPSRGARTRAPRRRPVLRPRSRLRPSCSFLTIAEALGVREGEAPLAEAVAEHLRSKRILLVPDNFELASRRPPFVATCSPPPPACSCLATSRAPLRLAAEHEYPVPPLPRPTPTLRFDALVRRDALACSPRAPVRSTRPSG